MGSTRIAAPAEFHDCLISLDRKDPWEEELNRDVAFTAVRAGKPLYTLPECLRADKEVVMAAIACEGAYCFDYIASRKLQEEDRDVVMALVASDGAMLEHACEALRADRQVVLVALRTHANALALASKALQADKELKAKASSRWQEEQRLLKRYIAKACGPGPIKCLAV